MARVIVHGPAALGHPGVQVQLRIDDAEETLATAQGVAKAAQEAAKRAKNMTGAEPARLHSEAAAAKQAVAAAEEALREAQTAARAASTPASDPDPGQEPDEPATDLGDARRLVRLHGRDLRCVAGLWYYYDGQVWRPDPTGAEIIRRLAQVAGTQRAAAAELRGEARAAATQGQTSEAARLMALADQRDARAKRLETHKVMRDVTRVAAAHPRVAARMEDFDRDPMLLACANGTIELQSCTLREHRREDMITRMSPVAYDPTATCPRWEQALAQAQPDPDMPAYLQRAVGYSLTGETREEAAFFLFGIGANGKSTFVTVLALILGDYCVATRPETYLAKDRSAIPNDIAALAGARMITASESEEGRRLDDSAIKTLASPDRVSARFLRQEFFSFIPTGKTWFSTNHRPIVRGTDDGIWRRMHLIGWPVSFRGREDRTLGAALRAEAPGILAWAVRGCMAWQQIGLAPPPGVVQATQDYRAASDVLGRWLAERCTVGGSEPGGRNAALYADFKTWMEIEAGEKPWSHRTFSEKLKERGHKQEARADQGRRWLGITLGRATTTTTATSTPTTTSTPSPTTPTSDNDLDPDDANLDIFAGIDLVPATKVH